MTMVGLFFTQEHGDNYHAGEIIRKVHDNAYLVKLDQDIPVDMMVLYTVHGIMSEYDETGYPMFRFFETRKDLQAWVDWLGRKTEEKPSVVRLIKK